MYGFTAAPTLDRQVCRWRVVEDGLAPNTLAAYRRDLCGCRAGQRSQRIAGKCARGRSCAVLADKHAHHAGFHRERSLQSCAVSIGGRSGTARRAGSTLRLKGAKKPPDFRSRCRRAVEALLRARYATTLGCAIAQCWSSCMPRGCVFRAVPHAVAIVLTEGWCRYWAREERSASFPREEARKWIEVI